MSDTVEELTAPGVFNILDALQGRGYPTDEVVLHLDEATAHKIAREDDSEKLAELRKILDRSAYTFHLTGISSAFKDALRKKAFEVFPSQYDHSKNFLTGQVEKVEKPVNERSIWLGDMLMAAQTTKIVGPDGGEDHIGLVIEQLEDDSLLTALAAKMRALATNLPTSQFQKWDSAVESLNVEASAFEGSVDADF